MSFLDRVGLVSRRIVLAVFDERVEPIEARLARIEKQTDRLLGRIERMQHELERVEKRQYEADQRIAQMFGAFETFRQFLPPRREDP